jgi:hypothetical protein
VAQTVGFDLGKSKMLYLSMENSASLPKVIYISARPERPISSSASSKIDARFGTGSSADQAAAIERFSILG